MKVAELVRILQTHHQDLDVIFDLHSEFKLLESTEISIIVAQPERPDGWVHRARPDKPAKPYLAITY